MCPPPIVGPNKGQNVSAQFRITLPRPLPQTLALQGAEPNLNLIQPRRMFGQKVPDHASRVLCHPFHGWWGRACRQVVTHQMQDAIRTNRQGPIQVTQKIDQLDGTMARITTSKNVPRPHLQGGIQVERTMTDIFKFAPRGLSRKRWRHQFAFHDLE